MLSGSLPPGAAVDWYATITAKLKDAGRRVAVDTSGEALKAVVSDEQHLPDLLKPNAEELASLTGDDGDAARGRPAAAAAAAAAARRRGHRGGPADARCRRRDLDHRRGHVARHPPPITLRSTVGAGDASLAGYLLADLRSVAAPERLREAVAYGAAAASLPGSTMPREADLDRAGVVVTVFTAAAERRLTPRGLVVPELINSDLVTLDAQFGDTKDDVIRALAQVVADAGRSSNPTGLADDAFAREAKSATGMPGGLAIPHCRSEHVTESTLAFARLAPPIDFGAKDGPADLVFMIAAPASGDQEHMRLLTKLARALVRPEFTASLRAATTKDEVVALVSEVVTPEPAAAPAEPAEPAEPAAPAAPADLAKPAAAAAPAEPAAAPQAPEPAAAAPSMTIVAVTACPTGIAHTYMAAEALANAGTRAGVNVVVEPQGSVGAETIDPAVIASASAVIFATDVGVRNKERFAGLPEISTGVKNGIHEADELVARAVAAANDPNAPRVSGECVVRAGAASQPVPAGMGTRLRTALLTGVSYMIPFVAAGGLLIALGFLLGGYQADPSIATTNSLTNLPGGPLVDGALFNSSFCLYLGAVFIFIGKAAFALFVPALAGYIAYRHRRPAGHRARIRRRPHLRRRRRGRRPRHRCRLHRRHRRRPARRLHRSLDRQSPGARVRPRPDARRDHPAHDDPHRRWLDGLGPRSPAFVDHREAPRRPQRHERRLGRGARHRARPDDVLRPRRPGQQGGVRLRHHQSGRQRDTANFRIMAAVMLTGMVPPLALALASTVRPKLFTEPERENGRAAWLLGASFISEGAIPFAAADPLRIIPPVMLGGAVTGALSELLHVGLHAPHGGIFVLFAVDNVLGFIIALAAGTVVAAIGVVALKSARSDDPVARSVDSTLVNA